jgi:UDP-N-acetyl-D-mannosaminuronic acid transferase (WecB/TagA/CpsF family)
MHDAMMTWNDTEKQAAVKNLILGFSGSLQTTPLTRNLAPRFHVNLRGSWLNYRIFLYHVDKHPTLAWNLLLAKC